MPSSNGSLVTFIKLKAKYRLHAPFHILLNRTDRNSIVFEDLLPYTISCPNMKRHSHLICPWIQHVVLSNAGY